MEQDASQRGQARAVETRGQNSEARTRVVVIGAGFGGLQVARALARDEHVQLAVVDRGSQTVCGKVSIGDLLRGRSRSIERESERLRLFRNVPPQQQGHN